MRGPAPFQYDWTERVSFVFYGSFEMFRPGVSLHTSTRHRLTFDADAFDSVRIYLHDARGSCLWCQVKELMLIPKTVREVERYLLLLETGRGVFVPREPAVRFAVKTFKQSALPRSLHLYKALYLLTRLQGKGHLGKAIVAHVLTILGGPMERTDEWGPGTKRRLCKVTISTSRWGAKYTPRLGSVENWHATD